MQTMRGPTLTNPFQLATVEELQRELDHANQLLLKQFMDVMQMGTALDQMALSLNAILVAHLRGDTMAVSGLLNAYLAPRERLRQQLETKATGAVDGAIH